MANIEQFWAVVKEGSRNTLEEILREDPSLAHAKTDEGVPAAMLAVYYGHTKVADSLIRHGAELDLFLAAAMGREIDVRAILAASPERVNESAPDGFSPLGLAAYFGQPRVVETLLGMGADVNQPARSELAAQPLHSAAAARQIVIAQRLLDAGADVNAVEGGGFTPLHIAADNGQFNLVKLLLERGANPDARTDDGKTPRDLAAEKAHTLVNEYFGRLSA